MGVVKSKRFLDGYTPVCNDCGIVSDFDIGHGEYQSKKAYWDAWKCGLCEMDSSLEKIFQPSSTAKDDDV